MKSKIALRLNKAFVVFALFAFLISPVNSNSDNLEQIEFLCDFKYKKFNLVNYLPIHQGQNTNKNFPFKLFIDSASWWNFKTINETLLTMNTVFVNSESENEEVLLTCLTDSLLNSKWNCFNLDTLDFLLSTSEHYLSFAEANPERKYLFKPVAVAWCSFVSNQLSEASNQNSSLKYSLKFQYVAQHSRNLKCSPDIRYSNSEKLFIYLTEQKWSYLFMDRYWKGTSTFFKIATILPLLIHTLIFIYGCFCIFHRHLKKIKQ
jgi:hypothetical protein